MSTKELVQHSKKEVKSKCWMNDFPSIYEICAENKLSIFKQQKFPQLLEVLSE